MNNIYFVSDTHFNHSKLCSGSDIHFDVTRKYIDITEMNSDIIKQWNNTITNNDTVIFLGDFLLGTPVKETYSTFYKFYNQLNHGKFIWIIGNHDHILKKKLNDVFEFKTNMQFEYNGVIYTMQHNDFNEIPDLLDTLDYSKKNVLIHGHTHSSDKLSTVTYKKMNLIQNNVCWDAWYKPVNINELVTVY